MRWRFGRLFLRSGFALERFFLTADILILGVDIAAQTFDDGACEEIAVEVDGSSGVVISWDGVVDSIKRAIGVDNGDNGDSQFFGFFDGDVIDVGVDDKDNIRTPRHIFDSDEDLVEFIEFPFFAEQFSFGESEIFGIIKQDAEFFEVGNGLRDGLPVGEGSTEPTVIDVILVGLQSGICDGLPCLFFCADKECVSAIGDDIMNSLQGPLEQGSGFVEVDNVDAISCTEDVAFHFGVPTVCCVSEVNASFDELSNSDRRYSHEIKSLSFPVVSSARL